MRIGIGNHENYDELYKNRFHEKIKNCINTIRIDVVRFIRMLKKIFELNVNPSYYLEIGKLKVLISLKIQIDLMLTRNDNNPTNFNEFSYATVTFLLVKIIELQRFISVNCEYGTLNTTTISYMFGIEVLMPSNNSKVEHLNYLNDFF